MQQVADRIFIHLGDWREAELPLAPTAVITDPPYGCKNDCNYSRFSGGLAPSHDYIPIAGDDEPFDPTPFLNYPKVVLWGYQHFAQHLPLGTLLVWGKKRDNQLGTFLSDGEVAWMKGGRGLYLFRHVWHGFDRESERGKSLHPSQKPVALMEWVLERSKINEDDVVFDPYMGTGCIGLACRKFGCGYIGCEVEPGYYEVARGRLGAQK